jgi:subtilisin-like proprotein convertase family protein/subtilisin family serine protease
MEIIKQEGLVIEKKYEQNTLLLKVTSVANANPIKVANRLMESGNVEYAEPNVIVQYKRMYIPKDPLFKEQWHLSATPDFDIVEGADVLAPEAWELTRGKHEVVVALLDDGFDLDHPDLKGDGKIVAPKDYVDGDISPFPVKEHEDYHGTPCAGVAIAEENGIGCTGIAPGCAFMPIRFDLNASDTELVDIFEYISKNADIVSCSWGPSPGNYPLPTLLFNKIHELVTYGGKRGKGLVIVFAAGNDDVPINLEDIVNGFASHPDIIAVSASTSLNTKALYSNWGKEISVAAPSNNFNPLDGQALFGRGITTTDNEIHGSDFTPGSEYTSIFGGTSSATPLVAGTAGLILSINPNLTAKEVKEILQITADKIIDPGEDPILKTRKGTYDGNGHSEWFGYGKVNAYRAVVEALKRRNGWITNVIQRDVSPSMDIPDNDPAGIKSTLLIDETGKIEEIKVNVNITHKYIGDLVVALTSPLGDKAILHNRSGTRTRNINKTYDASTTKSLRSVLMKEIHGVWTLEVSDMVKKDTGKLDSWGLEIKAISLGNDVVRLEIKPEVTDIPDNDPEGIRSSIMVDRDKKIRDVKAWVDITHSWIGDLTIDIISPSGTSVRLHDREGRSQDNIIKTYSLQDTPQLRQFLGENAKGEWVLKVADLAAEDEGDLNRWGLEINLES